MILKPEGQQSILSDASINAGVGKVIVGNGSLLSSCTITFPTTPNDRDNLLLFFNGGVTALTITAPFLGDVPTTAINGAWMCFEFDGLTGKWYQLLSSNASMVTLVSYQGQLKISDAAPASPAVNDSYKLIGTGAGSTPSGTYANLLGSGGAAIVIPAAATGNAIINASAVWNGTYWVPLWLEVTLPNSVGKIAPWSAVTFSAGDQVLYNNMIWEASNGAAPTDIPGSSIAWSPMFPMSMITANGTTSRIGGFANPTTTHSPTTLTYGYIPYGFSALKKTKLTNLSLWTNNAASAGRMLYIFTGNFSGSDFVIKSISAGYDISAASNDSIINIAVTDVELDPGDYFGIYTTTSVIYLRAYNGGTAYANIPGWVIPVSGITLGGTPTFTADNIDFHYDMAATFEDITDTYDYLPTAAADGGFSSDVLNYNLNVTSSVTSWPASKATINMGCVAAADGWLTKIRYFMPTTATSNLAFFTGDMYLSEKIFSVAEISETFSGVQGWHTYVLSSPIRIKAGQYIGVTADNAGCNYVTGSDPRYLGYYLTRSSFLPNTGKGSYVLSAEQTYGFVIEPYVVYGSDVFALNTANKANGAVLLDSNKQIEKGITTALNGWAGKKILWVGTSIPARNSLPQYEDYPTIVGRLLNAIMVNHSASSSYITSNSWLGLSNTIAEADAMHSGAGSVYSYESLIIGQSADLLVIDHTVNDVLDWVTKFSLGDITSTDRTNMYGAFNRVIQYALADNPMLKVLIVSPPNRYTNSSITNLTEANIDTARTILQNVATKYSCPFCDLATLCNINSFNYSNYKADGLHPVYTDIARLAGILANFIQKIA